VFDTKLDCLRHVLVARHVSDLLAEAPCLVTEGSIVQDGLDRGAHVCGREGARVDDGATGIAGAVGDVESGSRRGTGGRIERLIGVEGKTYARHARPERAE
jgi:hypothetical protein